MISKKECLIWLDALRSGKYRQGCLRLFNPSDKSYCCMGVYAEVSENYSLAKGNRFSRKEEKVEYSTDLSEKDIPSDIQEILMTANDSDNKSFSEIADYIEKELLPILKD